MTVVVLFAASPDPAPAISAALATDDLAAGLGVTPDRLVVITGQVPQTPVLAGHVIALDEGRRTAVDLVLRATGITALHRRLARFPAGRLVNSLGPADTGRAFWRALHHRPDALGLIAPGSVIVAGDLAATRAAWSLWRRDRTSHPVLGLRDARAAIDGVSAAR
jgi:hypothetical protein